MPSQDIFTSQWSGFLGGNEKKKSFRNKPSEPRDRPIQPSFFQYEFESIVNENEWAKLVSLQPAKLTLTSRKGDFHSGLVSPMKKSFIFFTT